MKSAAANALAAAIFGLGMADSLHISKELSAVMFAAYGLLGGSVQDLVSFKRQAKRAKDIERSAREGCSR